MAYISDPLTGLVRPGGMQVLVGVFVPPISGTTIGNPIEIDNLLSNAVCITE